MNFDLYIAIVTTAALVPFCGGFIFWTIREWRSGDMPLHLAAAMLAFILFGALVLIPGVWSDAL